MKNPLAAHIAAALETERKTLTRWEEIRLLRRLHAAPGQLSLLTQLYFYTGCRVSEGTELRRYQLDSQRCLVVFRTLKQETETYREVPIPRHLMRGLLAIEVEDGEVLWSKMSRWTALRHISEMMEALGIPPHLANIRTFRHCYCERGVYRNVDKRIRDALMGHRPSGRSKTSNDHYGKPRGRHLRRHAKRMGSWRWHDIAAIHVPVGFGEGI